MFLREPCNSDTIDVRSRARGLFGVGRCSMVDRPVGNPTSKELTVGRFKVSRYLAWRQREGSAIVPRCGGFPLSLTRTAGSVRSLAVGVKLLWRSRILHQSVQFTTNASAFGCYLFASLFPEHHHKSNEFEGSEQSVVILPIDNDVIIRRKKLLTDTGGGSLGSAPYV